VLRRAASKDDAAPLLDVGGSSRVPTLTRGSGKTAAAVTAAARGTMLSAPEPLRHVRALPVSGLQCTPWKNGGGVTRQVAAYPAGSGLDDFVWRISIADVKQDGPFSQFPGVERMIALLEGAGMRLVFSDQDKEQVVALMTRFKPFRFAGESTVRCELAHGPTVDLNLMVRRAKAAGDVQELTLLGSAVQRVELAPELDFFILFCCQGSVAVELASADGAAAHEHHLGAYDALELGPAQRDAEGASLLVRAENGPSATVLLITVQLHY
jgi:environmental stress-induced protein Ves